MKCEVRRTKGDGVPSAGVEIIRVNPFHPDMALPLPNRRSPSPFALRPSAFFV